LAENRRFQRTSDPPHPGTVVAVSALRAGEVDIIPVTGDFLKQAKQEGFRIHEIAGGLQYWIALPGQTVPDKRDYGPTCPWVGDPKDSKSQENARKVRMALNLAVNKRAIVDKLWTGHGSLDPFGLYYYPNQPGFSKEWKIPPYDPQGAKQLLIEAGYPKGFEITLAMKGHMADAPDVGEAVALDWERIGIKVKRHEEPWSTLLPKVRRRNTGGVAVFQTGRFSDEPVILLDRTTSSLGRINFAAETPEYDQMIKALLKELTCEASPPHRQLAQKMYDDARRDDRLKSNTFAMGKRIASWRTVYGAPSENNLDYITWSGQ
jgi:ABC-type transport system substrate-binding protein